MRAYKAYKDTKNILYYFQFITYFKKLLVF